MDIEKAKETCKAYINAIDTFGTIDYKCINNLYEPIETVLSELEKKEAIINEMSNFINLMSNELVVETGNNNLEFCKMQKCIDNRELDCEECIKEYFTKKVEGK